ncbi:hypothetical protein J3R03_008984 [Actinoplanes couchii]|nr:hypothetical protein [Actinoplanes couchii]
MTVSAPGQPPARRTTSALDRRTPARTTLPVLGPGLCLARTESPAPGRIPVRRPRPVPERTMSPGPARRESSGPGPSPHRRQSPRAVPPPRRPGRWAAPAGYPASSPPGPARSADSSAPGHRPGPHPAHHDQPNRTAPPPRPHPQQLHPGPNPTAYCQRPSRRNSHHPSSDRRNSAGQSPYRQDSLRPHSAWPGSNRWSRTRLFSRRWYLALRKSNRPIRNGTDQTELSRLAP